MLEVLLDENGDKTAKSRLQDNLSKPQELPKQGLRATLHATLHATLCLQRALSRNQRNASHQYHKRTPAWSVACGEECGL